MPSIFSRIIAGEIPCWKVAENDQFIAFLDIRPVAKGHCLVVPKNEVDYIFDLPNEELAALHLFAKQVALALEAVVPCVRIGITVLGLEVPHAHIHLVPLDKRGIIDFKAKYNYTPEEQTALAAEIAQKFITQNP